LSDILKTNY